MAHAPIPERPDSTALVALAIGVALTVISLPDAQWSWPIRLILGGLTFVVVVFVLGRFPWLNHFAVRSLTSPWVALILFFALTGAFVVLLFDFNNRILPLTTIRPFFISALVAFVGPAVQEVLVMRQELGEWGGPPTVAPLLWLAAGVGSPYGLFAGVFALAVRTFPDGEIVASSTLGAILIGFASLTVLRLIGRSVSYFQDGSFDPP